MKNLVYLLLVLVAPVALQAQTLSKKEARKHRKEIEESRKEGSIIVSLDTCYYRGNAQFVMLYDHTRFHPHNYTIKALEVDQTFINAKDYTGNWVEFQFPTLEGYSGYIKHSMYYENVARTIIEQDLMTKDGLNMTGVKSFLENYKSTSRSAVGKAIDDLFDNGSDDKKDQE